MTRKDPIPLGLEVADALEYMHEHGFRNRHPGIGSTAGMMMTYYELCDEQDREGRK